MRAGACINNTAAWLMLSALIFSGCASDVDLKCQGCDRWSFKFQEPMYLLARADDDVELTTDTITWLFQNAVPAATKQGHDVMYLNVHNASGEFACQAALIEARTKITWAPQAREFY